MNTDKIKDLAKSALDSDKLMQSTYDNLIKWLDENFLPDWALTSLDELFQNEEYEDLNDRFFAPLAFGTGGMRGRTIAKVPTKAELGEVSEEGTPEHSAVGAANMNDFNVLRATLGLFNYCKKFLAENNIDRKPRLVIAYDVRHFSKRFCDLAASIWIKNGGQAYIFDGPRSTPQLSFTVINLKADAGIVITASHNPWHDNGYKVYFNDGAQAIDPHASNIVNNVNELNFADIKNFIDIDDSNFEYVPASSEEDYIKSIDDCVIDKEVMKLNKPSIVFTPIHGTGATLCPTIMRHFGLEPILVEEQMKMHPQFPTVKQPNPEYAQTLTMGLDKAIATKADCIVATDPDADRMGAAVRTKDGTYKLITGNMIGSLLAEYRIMQMKNKGIIVNPKKCTLVKTFVTTPLQDKIAQSHDVGCINTLTGFKWIGAKLKDYETQLAKNVDVSNLSYVEKAKLLQEYSKFFVFGGEESYGYLGLDTVRDKDANSAVIMFSEMIAYLKSQNKTVDEYLDEIYLKCGYYLEDLKSIYKEGASGSIAIKNFLQKLSDNPLEKVGDVKVAKAINFAKDTIIDDDGQTIPSEKFFFYTLENEYSFAIRGSGTEPKIKFYAFAKEVAKDKSELENAKQVARESLTAMLDELEKIFEESCS